MSTDDFCRLMLSAGAIAAIVTALADYLIHLVARRAAAARAR